MPIKIKIGSPAPLPPQATISIKVKKTLDGNLIISDHSKLDIVVIPSEGRIMAMAKPYAGDNIYEYQRDLLDSLIAGGVVSLETVQGAPMFGVLEATFNIPPEDDVDPVQVVLLEIERFVKESSALDARAEEYDQDIEDRFTDPNTEDSTELGEIKPEEEDPYRKARVQDPTYTFVGYGYLY